MKGFALQSKGLSNNIIGNTVVYRLNIVEFQLELIVKHNYSEALELF